MARYFKSVLDHTDLSKLDSSVRGDPDAIERMHISQKNSATMQAEGKLPANLTSQAELYNPGNAASAATGMMYRKLIIEWEMSVLTIANIVNSSFFAGVCAVGDGTASRTTRDSAGFGLVSDALVAVTDQDSNETTDTTTYASVSLANHTLHLFRVEISRGLVVFSVDGVLASLTTNPPGLSGFFVVNAVGEGGAAAVFLGPIRAWPEDE